MNEIIHPHISQEDKDFNEGTALWNGKQLMHMSTKELYIAFNELGRLYQKAVEDLEESGNYID